MARSLLAALVAVLAFAQAAQAQSDALRRVVLADGTVLVGFVADEGADPVVLTTESGVEQRIPRAQVVEIAPLIAGRFFRLDPTRTRLVLSPTGRTLGGGRTRVGTLLYIVPNATVGLNDRLDLGGTLFFSFGSDYLSAVPVVGAKFGVVDTGSFALAVGGNVGTALGEDTDGTFVATPYAAVTIGDEIRSLSASVTGLIGASLSAGDIDAADGVLLAVGGEAQLNNGVKILADVGVPIAEGGSGAVVAPGVRFFGDRYSVDLFGVLGVADGEFGGFAPIGNFAFNF
ncbi:hypothetical protein [Rubrivirga marina]|uniref:Uncharacterized protein n=1 Tax=Rubrivirga marina TaxID=1196024 RepID=A0A271IYS8_9BACT|nr:hypothetical protein [Rubrivirga marina]PAP76411.1 hypothetical protein BSZ37_08120 [Rubrivirga marina]